MRKILVIIGLGLAVLLFFPYSIFSDRVFSEIQQQAKQHRIHLQAKEFVLNSWHSAEVEELQVTTPVEGLPLVFFIDQAQASLRLLSLLYFQPIVDFELTAYDGQLLGELQSESFRLNLRQFPLQSYPLFLTMGFRGLLEGQAQASSQEKVNFSFQLHQGQYLGDYKIKGIFPIPEMHNISGKVVGKSTPKRLSLSYIDLDSSHASLKGRASFGISRKSWSCDLEINLSEEGYQQFASYLILASGMELGEQRIYRWRLTASQNPGQEPLIAVGPHL